MPEGADALADDEGFGREVGEDVREEVVWDCHLLLLVLRHRHC